eukprot:maker-scaffold127_size327531-snap-gene-2.26 protein:Tk07881 transcript:maker-scaffold127_size327531-snap-gene-2.26-mRNA-1 annotation:"saposin isoform 1"
MATQSGSHIHHLLVEALQSRSLVSKILQDLRPLAQHIVNSSMRSLGSIDEDGGLRSHAIGHLALRWVQRAKWVRSMLMAQCSPGDLFHPLLELLEEGRKLLSRGVISSLQLGLSLLQPSIGSMASSATMKTSLILGLTLLGVSLSSAGLLGSTKCTWGPSYWCQGFPESRQCSATNHCIQNVWSQKDLPEDDDDVCTICKNMVKEARDTLESDELQLELKQVFEGSCSLIPLQIISDECKTLADQFIPELIETLASEMNPQLVCATAGLCNSVRIDNMLANMNEITKPKSECDVCKLEANQIGSQIQTADKDLVVDKLLEICGQFSSYSDACRITVLDNFEIIYNVLTKMDSRVCDLSGMCSETFQNIPARYSSTNKADIQCEFCEKVVQHWVDTWTANTTQSEFKEVMDAICQKLDKADRVQHCLHIVDDYYVPWFNYLLHEVNPSMVCSMVGLCGSPGFLEINEHMPITLLLPSRNEEDIPITRLQPAIRITGMEESMINTANHGPLRRDDLEGHDLDSSIAQGKLIGGYFVPQTVALAEKPGCMICEYALHELQEYLGDEKTEAEVEAGLEKLCHMMPSSVADQCDHLVETYGALIVQMVIHDINPTEICQRLQLCTGSLLEQQVSHPLPVQLSKKDDDNCALCQYVMTTVNGMITDKSDQRMIINLLDSICYKVMPASISNECEKFVAEYTTIILDFVAAEFTAEQICTELQLCVAQAKELESEAPPTALTVTKSEEKCIFCEFAMSEFDLMLRNPYNRRDLAQSLADLCSEMPSEMETKCQKFVHKYATNIVKLISVDVAPWMICPAMDLCQRDSDETAIVDEEVYNTELGDERPYCTLCEYAIGEVDQLIEDKKNEKEIIYYLDKICYHLSIPIQKECLNLVEAYTDKIIKMFVADYSPEQVCSSLHLCQKVPSGSRISFGNDVDRYHANAIPSVHETREPEALAKDGPCVMCKFAITIMEKQILTNRSLDMAERAVQMMCSYLPESVAEKCEEFVDIYGEELIRMIVHTGLNPEDFCSELGICTDPEDEPALMGARKSCVWGPAFWCQTPAHAKACGTTKHCKKYVWNKN